MCTRAVCVLAHYFEKLGIASIAISLIRLTAEKIAPPRSLWVPFELGRPFGDPNDSKTQLNVVKHALSLLNKEDAPVLEDFPDQYADPKENEQALSCPVSFSPQDDKTNDRETLFIRVTSELSEMAPWYELAKKNNRGTTLDKNPDTFATTLSLIQMVIQDGNTESPDPTQPLTEILRLATNDLKAYMTEGASAWPDSPSGNVLTNWFWEESQTGEMIKRLREFCLTQNEEEFKRLGFLLVPLERQRN